MNDETHNLILVGIKKAAELLDISPRFFASMESAGSIGPVAVRLGTRKLYRVEELRKWTACGCPTRTVWQDMIRVKVFPWKNAQN